MQYSMGFFSSLLLNLPVILDAEVIDFEEFKAAAELSISLGKICSTDIIRHPALSKDIQLLINHFVIFFVLVSEALDVFSQSIQESLNSF